MQATELRIGNYHLYHIVDKLDERGEHDEVCQIDAEDFRILENFDCPEYKPIPLTEEWLLKVGARKVNHIHGYVFWTLHNTKLNNAPIDIYEHRTEFNNYGVKHCKYFHQLQNLYFALTGEELTINKEL